ncbi:Interleukin-4 receptor subunit alpha [Chelonia mydas]|uniref:Interleukin-4 receptor subunit alpha n=1 Tax=Chelonia mydas TaxID=8469 RepID=M7BJI7_CHEMY|nr:Interleukin-4 receptor subunit alpha [Chelonia mydas]
MATGRIQRFECFTDYARELSCHWEAAAQTNCSKEFRLYYKKEILSTVYNTCIPETGKGSSMNSVSNCICIILPEYFTAGLAYHLALQANGTVLWNDTVEVAYIVKPRPPTNLTIEKGENGNFYVLRWIESYSAADMLYGEQVIYEVKYWNKQNPEEEFVEQLPYQTTHFEIRATQLKQGYDYLVRISVWRKMLSTDEIKAPFYDVKQTHMEHQLSCKNCLAKYAQGQTLKGKDNVKSGEKPGSCLNKCGEWFPEEYEAVLIPEITLIEDSLEICECSRNTETENHEDNLGEILLCPPCESSANSFIEHTQHNDALADMFIKLLECGTSIHDTEIPDFIIEEQKTFENCESENSSQQTPKENVVQDQQSGDTSHACSFSTTASQDDYNCRAASTKSVRSEESFESGYQSSNIDTASPEAKNPPDMLHQRHFLCSSETQHDLLVLIKKSPNAPSSEIIKDGINTPAYQSFDSLMSQSTEPCSTAYKSFDSLMSQSTEPCSTAYKSFDSLLSQSTESCSTAYKSFASLLSQSTVSNSLTQCLENPSSSLSLAEFPENQILPYREEQTHQPLGDQSCYTNHKGDCTETAFQTICSEDIDFPWFFSHAHDKVSFFLPEKEIHKQITCQHVPEKAAAISCPSVSNPSSYQPFGIALKDNNTHCDNNSEAISESPYKPFINLLNNNLKETLPAITVCESDLEINLSDFL